MHMLIIGGRQFLGRTIIEQAILDGHTITMFNRGKTNPEYIPEGVQIILGDRMNELHLLDDLQVDCIIDTCGYIPSIVEQSAKYFSQKGGLYCFISTLSVYDDLSGSNDEHGRRAQCDPKELQVTGENYGAMKAHCEDIIMQYFPNNALILRPGLIVGPHDPTDRFTYWPVRCGMKHSLDGTMLAPGNPNTSAWEFIDVRDVAHFTLHAIKSRLNGIFNVTGPAQFVEDILTESMACYEHTLKIHWIPDETLLAKGVIPWNDLPLWIPESIPGLRGFHNTNCQKAIEAGLTIRPLQETITDLLEWIYSVPDRLPLKTGPTEEQEAKLLGL
ncbi:MAG: NAD-dependent epimerase/dehydratase family protein [Bacteroidetes bacterium]|nr:NAD-dependent epimerase/dehydratase family protein [bacterium]NBP63459.1 NAD-dependent epimerase/dehydratase family protein [Bacteroidota bacterium]